GQAGELGSPEAALARDELVLLTHFADENGLDQAGRFDGSGEAGERSIVKRAERLVGIGLNVGDGKFGGGGMESWGSGGVGGESRRRLGDFGLDWKFRNGNQTAQPAAEPWLVL